MRIITIIIAAMVGCAEAATAMPVPPQPVIPLSIDSLEALQGTFANSQILDGHRDQSLLKVPTTADRARAWRITLQRLQREDGFAPLVIGGPANNIPSIISAQYQYANGFEGNPTWPPRRSNPVGKAAVQIAWGMSAANPARLTADWPVLGASIVVVGSYVEVFAQLQDLPTPATGARPVATATITPVEGLPTPDAGELSLTQQVTVQQLLDAVPPSTCPTWGAALFVPDFARRVRVVLAAQDTALCGPTFSVPFTGDPVCVGTWFDDLGNSIDSFVQGLIPSTAIVVDPVTTFQLAVYAPVVWHPVPANATMLAIRGNAVTTPQGFVHWRIAP